MVKVDMELQKKIVEVNQERQLNIFMEEPAELIQAISKMRRGKDVRANLVEELADNVIVIAQMMTYYNVSDKELQAWINAKQDRARKLYTTKE